MIDTVLAVLEIGKFDAPGSTPCCMPPSSEVVVLSDISPASFQAQSKRPSYLSLSEEELITVTSNLCPCINPERKVIVVKSSHNNNYEANQIHLIATRFKLGMNKQGHSE